MIALTSLAVVLATTTSCLAGPAIPARSANAEKRGLQNFTLSHDHPLNVARKEEALKRRGATNYNQDYTTGGSVYFAPASGEYYASWDTTDDFVVGVGWNPGSTSPITHGGSMSVTSGLATLSVYGWTTNPLVEYYIMENTVDYSQTGTLKGSVTSDGGTYEIWENTRTNEPSIEGTSTFNQYISVRTSGQISGTVTVENHFNAWASHGMDLGTLNFQVIAVESWDGAGTVYQTVAN
ncbi:endo-beta-1,4-xylanase [Xylariaceae sp. FL0255]|nr:endo-beta-1,4-xylanase [Xylariaceae sp. FL0255]